MSELIAGKYEILEVIGRGGMGTVYKARQHNLDRIVALKMLSEEMASDPEFRARFQQEAQVVARLNHPNIVAVYDIEPY
ncbi:MAG: serine/threonine-protein kinase, partial [Candidatus Hydrogenedentota bacterium]